MTTESDRTETVPSWDGDVTSFDSYVMRVKLYVRGTKKDEKGLCGPRLMSKLHGRAWQGVQKYEHIDTLDVVEEDPETKLPKGVSQLLKFLREKSGILEVEDAGKYMRMFMKETHRKPRMSMRDYLTQFEVEEDRMQKAIKQIDNNFDEKKPIFPEPLRAWFLLENAGLDDHERSQVLASVQNKYGYQQIQQALGMQFDKKHERDNGNKFQNRWQHRQKGFAAEGEEDFQEEDDDQDEDGLG